MKPALLLALLAVMVAGGYEASHRHHHVPAVDPAPGERIAANHVQSVLFVGDSLTAGFYASHKFTAFPAIVGRRLHARVTVRAKGGVKTGYWLSRPLPKAPLVVVELGTNDFSLDLTPPSVFKRNYRRLMRRLRGEKVLCLSVWRSSQYGMHDEKILTYNQIVAEECAGAFVWISDLYDQHGTRGPRGTETWLGSSDTLHPNDRGHALIAQRILAALR